MKTVTVEIEIDRASAILAGKSKYGLTTVEIDTGLLTADQRDELAYLSRFIGDAIRLKSAAGIEKALYDYLGDGPKINSHYVGYTTPIVDPTVEAIQTALDQHRARRLDAEAALAAAQAAYEVKLREKATASAVAFVETPLKDRVVWSGRWPKVYESRAPEIGTVLDPSLQEAFDAAVAEANAEATRLNDAHKAREQIEASAKAKAEKAKHLALSTFLADHGTPTQQKRRAANLMTDDEILRLVRDHVFAPLGHLQRYERMKASNFDEHYVEFSSNDAATCSDEQFEAMEAIGALLPESTVTLREHVAEVRSLDETHVKRGFLVTITWHGWVLSREYAAD